MKWIHEAHSFESFMSVVVLSFIHLAGSFFYWKANKMTAKLYKTRGISEYREFSLFLCMVKTWTRINLTYSTRTATCALSIVCHLHKLLWNEMLKFRIISRASTYLWEQPDRRVRCRAFLVWQSEDMFGYKLRERDSLLRLKSTMCVAGEFLIVCADETKEKLVWTVNLHRKSFETVDDTYLRARKRLPGNSGLVGGAQTSKGALTVQKARMLHCYQLQILPRISSCK